MKKGVCVICSESAQLTRDHVPPKGTVPPDPIVVKRLEEHIAASTTKPMPLRVEHRSRSFRTLCKRCNVELLGQRYDPALSSLANAVARWLRVRLDHGLSLPRDITVDAHQSRVARAIVGHLLAADEDPQRTLSDPASMFDKMRSFFLHPELPVPDDLHVYVWPYAGSFQVLIRGFCISTLGPPRYPAPIAGNLIKFYPLGFIVRQYSGNDAQCTSWTVYPQRQRQANRTINPALWGAALPVAGASRRQRGLARIQ